MKLPVFILFMSLCGVHLFAQPNKASGQRRYTLSGIVTDIHKSPLEQAQVIVMSKDSLCGVTLCNEKGLFSIGNLAKGEYFLEIQYPGLTSIEQNYTIINNSSAEFILVREMEEQLKDLMVSADRSQIVTRTATGQIFYLSEKAKSSGDPYQALNEIPLLRANSAMESVVMANGESPLILVDGNLVNTGVNPIDPKEIESVEIVDVVSARYLRIGVKQIINIKLKKKENPYTYLKVFSRYDIHRKFIGSFISELGTPTYSIYIRGGYDGIFQEKLRINQYQQDNGYRKMKKEILDNTGYTVMPKILIKWRMSEKDYFAISADVKGNLVKKKGIGSGSYKTNQKQNFTYTSDSRNSDYIFTGSLYHKHSFSSDNILETTFSFHKNENKSKEEQNETYPDTSSGNFYEYNNRRSSALLNVDYSWKWDKISTLNIGSETKYLNDQIHQISENYPIFAHREWNEYLYAGFSSKAGNFLYMISAGIEGIWLKAGQAVNCYVKPRVAVSGTYQFNKNQSLQIGYTLTNTPPSVGELNPYNTSADPLVIIRGNPDLLPVQQHKLNLNYTWNMKGFYIIPTITYHIYTDRIEPMGYTENGIYISTSGNVGFFKRLSLGGSINYKLNNWLNVYASAFYFVDYFTGQEPMKSFSGSGGFQITYKKWMLFASMEYKNYEYTSISQTTQRSPGYSHFQVKYNVTNDLNVSAAISGFIKSPHTDLFIRNGTYTAFRTQRMLNPITPWIMISYTLRKNTKRKIKLDNTIESTEKGIIL